MKVSELAKNYGVSSDDILATLKSLKLKAKDKNQELNVAVLSVLESALKREGKKPVAKKPTTTKKTADKDKPKPAAKKKAVKKAAKEKVEPKKEKTEPQKEKKQTVKVAKGITTKSGKKIATVIKKKIVKKKTVSSDTSKTKNKITAAPIITLKPLARKRKKPAKEETKETPSLEEVKENVQALFKSPQEQVKPQDADTPQEAEQPEEEKWARDASLPDIEISVPITVKDLSTKIQQKPSVVLKSLMKMGVLAHINQSLNGEVVSYITREFGYNLAKIKTQEENLIEAHKEEEEDPKLLEPRAPVVTFMGHVDHGKTSLLDKIRKSKVADKEHGGITQHMGAYSIKTQRGAITFLDTPGHEAFTAMRSRSAHITDLVVLVVAADEGIMPQTKEAIDHARAADVPIVVALNKIDKPNVDLDRVKKQLADEDLASEDWGGKTVVAGVSALTGDGIDELLELILLESELLELKANSQKRASGIVVEAHLSKGKGVLTTLIVQSGTLNEGDTVVVGPYYGKIKAMFDERHQSVKKAGPSIAVEVLGLPDVPEAGESFYVVKDERDAKEIAFRRQEQLKDERLKAMQKITLEDLYSQIQEGAIKEMNVIVKGDVQGSVEALRDSLEKIPSDKVKIRFIHSGVGDVNLSDVLLAIASKAIIIAFHVGVGPKAQEELEKNPVDVRKYRIIYDAVDDMKKALEGLLEAKTKKHFLSRIEIRNVFKLSKSGIVAGCYVTKGKVHRKARADIVRNGDVIFSGTISSLKRFKDDVKEVGEGMECGISFGGFDQYQVGDMIEAYEIEKIAQKL